jgi:GNAT superfamily N-acetyltransferase
MNDKKYLLNEVIDKALESDFLELPKRLYKGNRNWVCPLDDDIKSVFDPAKNKLFGDGEAIRWVAYDQNGEAVGRIAAFYNNEQAHSYEQPTGGCGFFEAINDQQLANQLFDAARMWLVSRGMEAMDGPINFGSRDSWWGLLVEGYEFQPLYANAYNPPYYKELFENYGFQNYFNQFTYLWRVYDDDINQITHDRAKRLQNTPGYSFASIKGLSLEQVAEDFRIIYNKAWSLFTGVKPMSKQDAQHIMETLRPIVDPNIVFFSYFNNEPIGFFIMVPDINRIIGSFNGKLNLWNKLRLMWELKVKKSCDRIFGIVFGVTPEFQGKGVESGMIQYVYENYIRTDRNNYRTVEFAWIGDFNPVMNRMIQSYVCATRHKIHTTYRYLFDRTKPFTRCPRLGLKRVEK